MSLQDVNKASTIKGPSGITETEVITPLTIRGQINNNVQAPQNHNNLLAPLPAPIIDNHIQEIVEHGNVNPLANVQAGIVLGSHLDGVPPAPPIGPLPGSKPMYRAPNPDLPTKSVTQEDIKVYAASYATGLKKDIAGLEKKLEHLTTKLTEKKVEVKGLHSKIDGLTTVTGLSDRIGTLKSENAMGNKGEILVLEKQRAVVTKLREAEYSLGNLKDVPGNKLQRQILEKRIETLTTQRDSVPGLKELKTALRVAVCDQFILEQQVGKPAKGDNPAVIGTLPQKIKDQGERLKAGVTDTTVLAYQAEKKGDTLFQKVFATKITSADGVETNLTSKDLKGILAELGGKVKDSGSEWKGVKANTSDPMVMRQLTLFRRAYVDEMMVQVKADLVADSPATKILDRACGSANITSDYDVNTSVTKGDIISDVKLVTEFNKKFKAEWGKEAGTVFDTNVYAKDFFPAESEGLKNKPFKSPVVQAVHEDNQETLALVKQRIFMSQDKWDSFVNDVTKDMPPALKGKVEAQYKKADEYHKKREEELGSMIVFISQTKDKPGGKEELGAKLEEFRTELNQGTSTALDASLKEARASFEGEGVELQDVVKSITDVKGKPDEDIQNEASNRLYELKLGMARDMQEQSENLDVELAAIPDVPANKEQREVVTMARDTLKVESKKLLGEALFFANEPYFCEGTIRHVVGNMQMGKKKSPEEHFEVSQSQGLQSINENMGDTLKDFEHYGEKGFPKLAYQSAKYFDRVATAIERTVGVEQKSPDGKITGYKIPDDKVVTLDGKEFKLADVVNELKASAKPLLQIRSGDVKFPGNDDTEKEANKNTAAVVAFKSGFDKVDVFKELGTGADDVHKFESLLLSLTSQVNVQVRTGREV